MLPIWSICTTLGLRGGDFTSNAQAFENKAARILLPIWSICTTLGLRGGDFTSNAQAFENKGARISFHPSPARQAGRQAGRQADNHNHLYVYTASGDDDIQPLSVL